MRVSVVNLSFSRDFSVPVTTINAVKTEFASGSSTSETCCAVRHDVSRCVSVTSADKQHSVTKSPPCAGDLVFGQFPLQAQNISLPFLFPQSLTFPVFSSQRNERILSCSLITKRAQFILFF